jgi:hypothetical protein
MIFLLESKGSLCPLGIRWASLRKAETDVENAQVFLDVENREWN